MRPEPLIPALRVSASASPRPRRSARTGAPGAHPIRDPSTAPGATPPTSACPRTGPPGWDHHPRCAVGGQGKRCLTRTCCARRTQVRSAHALGRARCGHRRNRPGRTPGPAAGRHEVRLSARGDESSPPPPADLVGDDLCCESPHGSARTNAWTNGALVGPSVAFEGFTASDRTTARSAVRLTSPTSDTGA